MSVPIDAVERTLLDLLRIPSFSGEEREAADYVIARLRQLGAEVVEDDAGAQLGGNAGNVLARLPGNVAAPPLLFNAHLDTVGRTDGLEPQVVDGLVSTGGATVLGGDDKAGVTAILEGVTAALASGRACPPLEILFTVSEETGLHGARVFDASVLRSAIGFVFDGGLPIGRLTMSAPSQVCQQVVFHGKASHAGVAPEQGVSAIVAAAEAIVRLRQGRLDDATTANVGVITGGEATNIVPARCELEAEVRSREPASLTAQVAAMRECYEQAAAARGCRLEYHERLLFQGFQIDPDEPAARLAAAAIRAAGFEPSYEDGGGGSDANIFNAAGRVRCVLLACGQQEPHTTAERVALADVAGAAAIVAAICATAGEAGR